MSHAISNELLKRFDIPGPRYTSYPTADRFVEAFNAEALKAWLAKRAVGGVSKPLSLYFHIPFCNTICYYCACNKIITKDHGRSAKYLKYLAKEIEMQAACLEGSRQVTQLHLGGGTPTFLSHDEMRTLMETTRKHFKLLDGGEYSIEVDPRKVDTATVALLGELGFNRMSVGVQDFDGKRQLLKAEDGNKDQSYFLYRLNQSQLKPAIFPLANWLKPEVRAKAEAAVEPRLLLAYSRIRQNFRNGLAVVAVERDSCGGCYNVIPPQRQSDIRLRKKMIVCEHCGRILVDNELSTEIPV